MKNQKSHSQIKLTSHHGRSYKQRIILDHHPNENIIKNKNIKRNTEKENKAQIKENK
jgi:hypothetical protein